MLDNQLLQLVIPLIQNGMTALGYTVPVLQSFQPTQQGVNTNPAFYIQKIGGDVPVGYPYRPETPGQTSPASFTASIDGTILTVSAVASGTVGVCQALLGDGIPANTMITQPISGTGGAGTYRISAPLTILSESMQGIPQAMIHTEIQQYESIFQLNALATQDPADANAITASDYLNYARYILQSSPTIAALESSGVGIYKISPIRNPYFHDDRDLWEANPNFDFVLTHKQVIVSQTPILQSETFDIYPI